VAIETMDVWGLGAADLVSTLGRRLAVDSGEPRSAFFLKQRIDIAIHRGNALSVLGTFASGATSADLSFI